MLYTYKPKYFLSLGKRGWIEFDDKWEFETTEDWQESVLDDLGATKVVPKKVKKSTKK